MPWKDYELAAMTRALALAARGPRASPFVGCQFSRCLCPCGHVER